MSVVAKQFDSAVQQRATATLGMWMFLGTELMFFGGLFVAYTVYRFEYPEAFRQGSHLLSVTSGTAMTAILLLSSLLVAGAHLTADTKHRKHLSLLLILTAVLGTVFLGLKFHEYWTTYRDGLCPGIYFDGSRFTGEENLAGHVELFFCFYFFMTGLHAIHMIIGIVMLFILAYLVQRGRFEAHPTTPIEMVGLYWHFVDIVWVFLFPILYLAGGR